MASHCTIMIKQNESYNDRGFTNWSVKPNFLGLFLQL